MAIDANLMQQHETMLENSLIQMQHLCYPTQSVGNQLFSRKSSRRLDNRAMKAQELQYACQRSWREEQQWLTWWGGEEVGTAAAGLLLSAFSPAVAAS